MSTKINVGFLVVALHALFLFLVHLSYDPQKIRTDAVVKAAILGEQLFEFPQTQKGQKNDSLKSDELFPVDASISLLALSNLNSLQDVFTEFKIENRGMDGERFYRFEELDVVAEPMADFVLPASSGIPVLVSANAEIYIDRFGNVQQVKLSMVHPESFLEPLRVALFSTKFKPAYQSGLAVNSVKIIQIAIRY